MEKFCKYLEDEGLPTDDSKTEFTIPIDVTYRFDKQLQIITPKRSAKNREFSFKQHGAAPYLTYKTMPQKIKQQPVIADWYTTVDVKQSQTTVNEVTKDQCKLNKSHIALLDINKLYFALEPVYDLLKIAYISIFQIKSIEIMHNYPSDITRKKFNGIRHILEKARRITKPRTVDLYDVFCAILYILKSGCQWRMLPKDYPKWQTVYSYFSLWGQSKNNIPSLLARALKKVC